MIVESNIPDGDEFYARLVALHDGLSVEQSLLLDARLILLLANQVGDPAVLEEILAAAAPVR
ncbi:MAG: DUF2783 domain-containing protein [Gammaproteobacteria bacterium]